MGAPTGSFEVWMVTWPLETGVLSLLRPVMVTVAGRWAERRLISAQTAASGAQVREAACSGVNLGGWLVGPMQRGSISPTRIGSPGAWMRRGAAPSEKATSIRQVTAPSAASRQRKVGGAKSGGKMDPSSG